MGMTIDESMKVLQEVPKVMPITEESINVALDTMRKYQKIEELAEYHMLRFLPKERMSKFQKDTLEVLEDGNDD